jgi:hypothetical protein
MARRAMEFGGAYRTVVLVAMPGSLSSVVLAMLGGHPTLLPAPELHLFSAKDLETLARADASQAARLGTHYAFTAGLTACLHGLGLLGEGPLEPTALDHWRRNRSNWPPGQVLAMLEQAAAPRRLVIKSGLLAFDRGALMRLRAARPDATVIALVRHPVDVVTSLLRRVAEPASPGLAAHLLSLWLGAPGPAQPIVGQEPLCVLRAEDATSRPRATLAPLLSALGLQFNEEVLQAILRTEEASFLPAARRMPGLLADQGFVASPRLRARAPSPNLVFPAAWRIPEKLAERVLDASTALGYG